jgi:tRNA (uracil-5-)-methyltransferase
LDFKREVIAKAFQRYLSEDRSSQFKIDPTHPSPKEYGYRTKITPHFDIPRSFRKDSQGTCPADIGFVEKGRRRILDIEGMSPFVTVDETECVIATAPLNRGLIEQRAIAKQKTYKRGATILLREATRIEELGGTGDGDLSKTYVTDPNEVILEEFENFKFRFPAGCLHL